MVGGWYDSTKIVFYTVEIQYKNRIFSVTYCKFRMYLNPPLYVYWFIYY